MAARCNIVSNALKSLVRLSWGIKPCDNTASVIIENYIEYLDCPDVTRVVCNPDGCEDSQNPIVFNCTLKAGDLLKFEGTGDYDVMLQAVPIGATGTPSYQWTFNSVHFTVVGDANKVQLKLKLKTGYQLNNLISLVKVTITDSTGCKKENSKQCYLVNGVINCAADFVPCYRPQSLVVTPM